MRFLGFVFVVVLILAGVGYSLGWFSVSTSQASGKRDVTLEVNERKLGDDTRAVTDRLGELTAKAVHAIKSLGRKTVEGSELEGTLASVDAAARDLAVTVGGETHEVHVPSAVPILKEGESVGFEALRPAAHVKLSFTGAGDRWTLTRVDILP